MRRKSKLMKELDAKLERMEIKIKNLPLEQAFQTLECQGRIESAFVLKKVFNFSLQQLCDDGKTLGYFV